MELERKRKRLRRALHLLHTSAVVVEGRKDALALAKAGFTAYLYAWAMAHPSAFSLPVVALTDIDREGERKAKALYEALSPYTTVDIHLRRELAYLLQLHTFEAFHRKLKQAMEALGCDYGKGVY